MLYSKELEETRPAHLSLEVMEMATSKAFDLFVAQHEKNGHLLQKGEISVHEEIKRLETSNEVKNHYFASLLQLGFMYSGLENSKRANFPDRN